MAYMHKETFEILQVNSIDDTSDDFFDVDDLIALPIQVLNLKGYKTRYCCCGHPFEDIGEMFSERKIKLEECPFMGAFKVEKHFNPQRPKYKYRILYRNMPYRGSYISFDKETVLPSLPNGFKIQKEDEDSYIKLVALDDNGEIAAEQPEKSLTITRDYDEETPVYEYFAELVTAMRELYEWALALPEVSAS